MTKELPPPSKTVEPDDVTRRAKAILDEVESRTRGGAVTVLAASKTQTVAKIRAAIAGGVKVFGENFLQDAMTKIPQIQRHSGIEWHFIGPIQSNKTKTIGANFGWVHTLDRVRIANRLNSARRDSGIDTPLNVCIEVNLDAEAQKSGLAPEEIDGFIQAIEALPYLNVRGLMAIPAPRPDAEMMRPAFRRLREIFEATRISDAHNWNTLSMGMSHDYLVAIDEGATIIRVGTALFGTRSKH